ncbi:MFS transporter [Actinomadura chokoriensis]|uniref:MFS transporter n=1 Tax=Actinomadura chokoriensis TaxID=454156 RepID=A0ABV4R2J3_9ACTN
MTGVFLSGMDTTIVVLALPTLERSLDAALTSLVWVVIGFLLVNTLLTTQAGRLGDLYGPTRVYRAGFFLLTLGSLLCGLAWDPVSVVAFRLLQGTGAACVTATSGAIIAAVFPPDERGRAYGRTGVAFSLGAVLGIGLGGLIISYVSWRWVFLINVPVGVIVMACARGVLHGGTGRRRVGLDLVGMGTLGAGLLCLLWAIIEIATAEPGPVPRGAALGGIALLGFFVGHERRQDDPMLRLSLFRIPALSAPLLAALFQGLANYAVLWLAIMYLQGPEGLSPLRTALAIMPGYVIAGIICLFSGRLADRAGPLLPVAIGLGAEVAALAGYAQITTGNGLWLVVAANIVNGIGLGFFIPANSSAVMKAAPPEFVGISSGMLRTFAGFGWVFSFPLAIIAASLSIPRDRAIAIFVGSADLDGALAVAFTDGLRHVFSTLAGIMLLALLVSFVRLIGADRRERPVPAPSAEQPQLSRDA